MKTTAQQIPISKEENKEAEINTDKQITPQNSRQGHDPEELLELCRKLNLKLTGMTWVLNIELIILITGIICQCLSLKIAVWILAIFLILLIGIYCYTIPLTKLSDSVLETIGEYFPLLLSKTINCRKTISNVKGYCTVVINIFVILLMLFPITIPLLVLPAVILMLSVFGIDGKTGEFWGRNMLDGFSFGIFVVGVIGAIALLAITWLHFLLFKNCFVVRKGLAGIVAEIDRQLQRTSAESNGSSTEELRQ